MARRMADVVAALDVVVGPGSDRPAVSASAGGILDGRARSTPKPPRKVAWSPTLGYAEVDAEVLAICRAGRRVDGIVGRRSRRDGDVFDSDPSTTG